MNRLTHSRSNGIKTGYWSPNKKDELVARLAAYEDTGLSPEDVSELREFISQPLNTALPAFHLPQWIPVEEQLPENNDYVLMSFENFSLPAIGRFDTDEDGGGAWYLGDDDEKDTCISIGLFVNAWMPLPEAYSPDH